MPHQPFNDGEPTRVLWRCFGGQLENPNFKTRIRHLNIFLGVGSHILCSFGENDSGSMPIRSKSHSWVTSISGLFSQMIRAHLIWLVDCFDVEVAHLGNGPKGITPLPFVTNKLVPCDRFCLTINLVKWLTPISISIPVNASDVMSWSARWKPLLSSHCATSKRPGQLK